MNAIREMIAEHGSVSCMRVLSLISMLVACAIGLYGVIANRDLYAVSMLVSVFVTASVGGKAAQKHIELNKK